MPKHYLAALSLTLAACSSAPPHLAASAAKIFDRQVASANRDCYLGVYKADVSDDGKFAGMQMPPQVWTPLVLVSEDRYTLHEPSHDVTASVTYNRDMKIAVVDLKAGEFSSHDNYMAVHSNLKGDVYDISTETLNDLKKDNAWAYVVDCSFGLSTLVDDINAQEEARMRVLGPPADWSDVSAPSLATLPVGTVLTLNRDLDIKPGTDTALTHVVEEKGLMSQGGFWALELPFRLAFAEMINDNNLYLYPTHYARGMKLVVSAVDVSVQGENQDGREYVLHFDTVGGLFKRVKDPITHIRVDGRRSGRHDIKIPQFIELMKPVFDVALPRK